MAPVHATLSDLHRADGSATFSQNGYSVIGAVNGPIEVLRRDELPEEAAIEVNVRPASGVGSPKERHLENLIHSTLRQVILVRNHPRTLIQVTLQVLQVPEGDASDDKSRSSILSILPALLQASILALVPASIPLNTTFSSAIVAITPEDQTVISPSVKQLASASSTHVLAFSARGDLLVSESEGAFDMDAWDRAHDVAKRVCTTATAKAEGDMELDLPSDHQHLPTVLKEVVSAKVLKEQAWKDAA